MGRRKFSRLIVAGIFLAGMIILVGSGRAQALSKRTQAAQPAAAEIIEILEPEDQAITTADSVVLSLKLGPQARTLLVNDQELSLAEGREVRAKVNLQGYGKHLIRVSVKDQSDNETVSQVRLIRIAAPTDVPSDNWANKAIVDLATLGVIELSAGNFEPDRLVDRGNMAVWLARVGGYPLTEVAISPFTDLAAADPLTAYVVAVSEAGLMQGYTDKTFKPQRTLNRAEAVAVVGRLAGIDPVRPDASPYEDLSLNNWVTPWAAALKERGWLSYLEGEYFSPQQQVSRLEVAWLIAQTPAALGLIDYLYGWEVGFVVRPSQEESSPETAAPQPVAQAEAFASVPDRTAKSAIPDKAAKAAVAAEDVRASNEAPLTDIWLKRADPFPEKVEPARPVSINPPQPLAPAFPSKVKNISMDFRDVDLANVLRVYSQETGINVVTGPDIRGRVNVSFSQVDPQKALDLILRVNGYTYVVKDGIVVVEPVGKANPLGRADTAIRSFEIEYGSLSETRDIVGKLLSPAGEVYVSDKQNILIVRDVPENLNKVAEVITSLDAPPLQVLVEAAVVETLYGTTEKLGVDWRLNSGIQPGTSPGETGLLPSYKPFGPASPPSDTWANKDTAAGAYGMATPFNAASPTSGLYVNVIAQGFEAYLTAMKSIDKNTTVLARPKVLAVDNKEAQILIGETLGYKTTTTTGSSIQENVSFIEVGTKLTFTPHVSKDGYILMEIHPEVSKAHFVSGVPGKETTECTTQALVGDGQTIVIGGLIKRVTSKSSTGIPFLSDIPLLGALFRSTTAGPMEDREIIVFIKPHIITRSQLAGMARPIREATEEEQKKFQENQNIFKP